jgi:hypothetical protein
LGKRHISRVTATMGPSTRKTTRTQAGSPRGSLGVASSNLALDGTLFGAKRPFASHHRPGALPITAAWPHKDEKPSRLCLCAAYIDPCIRLPSLPLLLCVHCTPQPAPCCAAESCPSISAHGRARARAAQGQGLQRDAILRSGCVLRSDGAFPAALAAHPLARRTLWRTHWRPLCVP